MKAKDKEIVEQKFRDRVIEFWKNKKAEELAMEGIVEGDKEFKERIEPSNATLSTFDFLRKEVAEATRQQTAKDCLRLARISNKEIRLEAIRQKYNLKGERQQTRKDTLKKAQMIVLELYGWV